MLKDLFETKHMMLLHLIIKIQYVIRTKRKNKEKKLVTIT